ncbi:unnamed protein product [Cuscuta europaea]|uniref:Membrane-associated kinase regulator 2 n=1 Tax=Cuscuta europaea TaxID=41803 RepID=A0A9P1EHQ3_CUSEU|nr:unnamed protein product [Cuscuta europaea]
MDAFSLLKFWRNGGTVGGISRILTRDGCSTAPTTGTTTILTAVTPLLSDSDSDLDSDGPFIDLEFTSAPEDEHGRINGRENDDGENSDQVKHNNEQHAAEEVDGSESDESSYNENEEGELNLTFSTSSGSSVDRTDPYGYLSPSDDLFCKGGDLFPVNDSETNSKFQASLVKTATKFRVLMLKLKKAKATNAEQKAEKSQSEGSNPAKPRLSQKQIKAENEKNESQIRTEKSSLTVRFKVEELNIIKSLFIRDTTSKNGNNGGIAAEGNSHSNVDPSSSPSSCPDEKKFSKELMMEKYLKMVKPLYVRVSRRYGEKLRFSGQLSLSRGGGGIKAASVSSAPPPQSTMEQTQKGETAPAVEISENTSVLSYAKSVKQGSLPAGLRVVRKHLVKSRSAPPAAVSSGQVSSRRRDDSLLQQEDGIQGAILHCKRSFNSTRDSNLRVLSRSTSEASQGNPVNFPGDEIEPVSQSG